jgi:O-antigen ligase
MISVLKTIYSETNQNILKTFANHLLVVITFFLPISYDAVGSGFFILIVLFLLQKKPFTLIKNALYNKVVFAIFMVWLIHIIGIVYSDDYIISSHYAKKMTFLLYPLLIIIFTQYRFLPRIFSAFILGVFLSELLSYGYFFELITSPIPQAFHGNIFASKNEPSPFTYHIEYGYILSITSALILQRLLIKTTRISKIFYTFFLITITLNVFLNSSRTGYLLFFISNGTILFTYYKLQVFKRLHYIIPFVLISLLTVWTSSNNLKREYHETMISISSMHHGDYNSSLGTRLNFIKMGATTLANSHLLFGFGTGMHGYAVYNEAMHENNKVIIDWLSHVAAGGPILLTDCEYNSILLEFGFIGLFLYFHLFYQVFRYTQKDKNLKATQNIILYSSLFYAFAQSLLFGILVPYIFIALLTLTLVKEQTQEYKLPKLTAQVMLIYLLGAIGLLFTAKIT